MGRKLDQLDALVDVQGRDGLAVDEDHDRLRLPRALRGHGETDAEHDGCGKAATSICQGVRHDRPQLLGVDVLIDCENDVPPSVRRLSCNMTVWLMPAWIDVLVVGEKP